MRLPLTILPVFALIAGCPSDPEPSEPKPSALGDFVVRIEGRRLIVASASDPSRILLESNPGAGSHAPLAVRTVEPTFEMNFGSWRITEPQVPWKGAAQLGANLPATFSDADGEKLATIDASSPEKGVLLLEVKASSEATNRIAMTFKCAPDDRFLGFGAQADGIDHRGHKIPVWLSEPGIGKSESDENAPHWPLEGTRHASSMGLPTWLSNRGYIGAVETLQRTVFDVCAQQEDAFRIEAWGQGFKLWIYDGPQPAKALERASAGVLGRPMRPPAYAFAPWLDAVHGPERVREVAALLRTEKIPTSAIWTEDFRGGGYVEGQGYRLNQNWAPDRTLYPDLEGLAAELRAQGFSWLAYYNTFLTEGTAVYDEAMADGHFVQKPDGTPYLFAGVTFKQTGLADLSRPATRDFVKRYLNQGLDAGFDGFMADYGEWLPHDAKLFSGEDPLAAHNRYARDWTELCAEVLAERAGDGHERLFFARAGWFGSNSHVPVFWAGDQRTSFHADDGLPTVIPMGLNLGLAAVSTYGHDIAGYQSAGNDPSTKELFFRWTSLGALSPVMRTHHGIKADENWAFDRDAETLAHFRRWAQLHVQLFPYLDAGSAQAEATGLPLMRAFPLVAPDDEAGWTIADQYFLGPSLLVAPIVEEGATSRTVHFPAGRFIPFAGGAPIEGPAELEVQAPVTELPIFVRAGSAIPLLPEDVQTLLPAEGVVDLEDVAGRRIVLLFPGGEGTFTERDGTAYKVTASASASAPAVDGAALPACASEAQRGCTVTEDGQLTVRLEGQMLEVDGVRLEVQGAARALDVRVVR